MNLEFKYIYIKNIALSFRNMSPQQMQNNLNMMNPEKMKNA